MLQDMAVVGECPDDVRAAKVHAQFQARIGFGEPVPIRNIDRVPKGDVFVGSSISLDHQKMELMDMKGMRLTASILDDPILHIPLMDYDVRWVIGIEDFGFVTFLGNVEIARPAGILRIFKFL